MRLKSHISIFGRIAGLALGFLVVLSASRLMLAGIYWDRVAPTDGLGFILLQGVRFDIILLGMVFAPVLLFKPWFHTLAFLRRIGMWLFPIYMALVTSIAFFIEMTTTSFIAEYGNRPNYLFVEYLVFPKEVFSMLAGSHLLELIALPALAFLLAWFVFKWLRKDPSRDLRVPFWFCLLATPLAAILVVAMVRSTLAHRPVNPSIAVFSQDTQAGCQREKGSLWQHG